MKEKGREVAANMLKTEYDGRVGYVRMRVDDKDRHMPWMKY